MTPTSWTIDAPDSVWTRIFVGTILQCGTAFVRVVSIDKPTLYVEVVRGAD